MRFSTRLWDGPGLCRMSLFVLLDDSGLLSCIYDITVHDHITSPVVFDTTYFFLITSDVRK